MRPASIGLILALLGACSNSSQSSGTCTADSDCPSGQFCNAAGFCQTDLGCTADSDCPNNQSCDTTSGQCICSSNSQCASGDVCNAAGKCEPASSCQSNQDCTDGGICDTASHGCIPAGTCAQNVQCPQGQICSNGACVTGCVNDGDCVLVDYSTTPPTYAPAACINFQCVANGCHSDVNCQIYSACLTASGGACTSVTETCTCVSLCGVTQFCSECDPTSGVNTCPNGGLCLFDPNDPASCSSGNPGSNCIGFCGIDCSGGQVCPNGTVCYAITAVNGETDVPGGTCNNGDTCDNSADGQANAPCEVQEGQQSGTCPCFSDNDCLGLSCVDGACLDGEQCAPDKQYTCQTLNCGQG